MTTRFINRVQNQRGNIALLVSLILGALLAVGGMAIETSMFMLKRQQLQFLAERVVLAAGLSLPHKQYTSTSATAWYNTLRTRPNKPDLAAAGEMTLTFDDNSGSVTNDIPYVVNSITATISTTYTPNLLSVGTGAGTSFTMNVSATARPVPTDVFIVMPNEGSFFANDIAREPFTTAYGSTQSQIYNGQCFTPVWRHLKYGVLTLYDRLSQLGMFRVGVMTSTSRTGAPFILAEPGTTTLTVQSDGTPLEYHADQPHYHSTRCAAVAKSSDFLIKMPVNPNVADSTWTPRTGLDGLLVDTTSNFYINNKTLLVREAIWIQQAGYSDAEGNQLMDRRYNPDPAGALNTAAIYLKNSRRSDNIPVQQRVVIAFTDDAGVYRDLTANDNSFKTDGYESFCTNIGSNTNYDSVKLGVIYYGFNTSNIGHEAANNTVGGDGSAALGMRTNCGKKGGANGIFYHEASSLAQCSGCVYPLSFYFFYLYNTPRIGQGLMQIELVA